MSMSRQNHANLFDDDAEMNFQIETLKEKIKVLENCDETATRKILALEDSIMHSAENAQEQFTKLSDKCFDFSRMLEGMRNDQRNANFQDANKLLELKRQNETYRDELYLLKKERERLSELQEQHYLMLQQEAIPESMMALQSMLISYRKLLANEMASKDSVALKLRSEVVVMEERLKAEQTSRSQMESSMASELHDARGEIVLLKAVKSDMENIRKKNSDIQKELEKSNASIEALKKNSNQVIQCLKEKHLAEMQAREQAEQTLAETRHRLKSLHRALETSEQVQRDFVRLSQSLQVELEHVKQERSVENIDSVSGEPVVDEALKEVTNSTSFDMQPRHPTKNA